MLFRSGIIDGGIRPFGICADTVSLPASDAPEHVFGFGGRPEPWPYLLEYRSLLGSRDPADPTGAVTGTPVVTFPIEKLEGTSPCGDAPGNFGQLDLAENKGAEGSGSCANPSDDDKLCDNTVNGFQGEIKNPGTGDTGNDYNTQLGNALKKLEASNEVFWIPVYTNVAGTGSDAKFTYAYWMKVDPESHCFTSGGGNDCREVGLDGLEKRWFNWEVLAIVDAVGEFSVAPPLTEDYQEFNARLCGVDGDESYC